MYIEEWFDTIPNMGYGVWVGKIGHGQEVKGRIWVRFFRSSDPDLGIIHPDPADSEKIE